MHTFNIVAVKDPGTKLYVGYIPGWPGAHSQGESIDELTDKLREVIEMLLEDGEPKLESEFVGVDSINDWLTKCDVAFGQSALLNIFLEPPPPFGV